MPAPVAGSASQWHRLVCFCGTADPSRSATLACPQARRLDLPAALWCAPSQAGGIDVHAVAAAVRRWQHHDAM